MALSAVPPSEDLVAYGGDTFVFTITAPEELVDGKEWSSQIKSVRTTDTVDATFVITPPDTPGGPATLVLPPDVTAALMTGGTTRRVRVAGTFVYLTEYKGVFDVEVSSGPDDVRTVLQGTLTVQLDVTRAMPQAATMRAVS